MFDWITRTKVFETMDVSKKEKFRYLLNENKIDYVVRMQDLNGSHPTERKYLGTIGKPKYVYAFWVKKKQASMAISLIRKI